jgi:methyl-accepting chemotaxis protein
MLIAVAAIAGLLGLLIPVLMRPLTTMGRAMQDIAEGEGDLTRRLAVENKDEFGELASLQPLRRAYPCLDQRSVLGHPPGA